MCISWCYKHWKIKDNYFSVYEVSTLNKLQVYAYQTAFWEIKRSKQIGIAVVLTQKCLPLTLGGLGRPFVYVHYISWYCSDRNQNWEINHFYLFLFFFWNIYWFERERERETSIGCLPYASQLQMESATQLCALTWNGTHNLLVCGTMLQPAEPSQLNFPLFLQSIDLLGYVVSIEVYGEDPTWYKCVFEKREDLLDLLKGFQCPPWHPDHFFFFGGNRSEWLSTLASWFREKLPSV